MSLLEGLVRPLPHVESLNRASSSALGNSVPRSGDNKESGRQNHKQSKCDMRTRNGNFVAIIQRFSVHHTFHLLSRRGKHINGKYNLRIFTQNLLAALIVN